MGHVEVNLPSSNSVSFSSLSGPLDIDWLGQLILVQPLRVHYLHPLLIIDFPSTGSSSFSSFPDSGFIQSGKDNGKDYGGPTK